MERMKILVFEYITGGGLNTSELPESLATEGMLMLQALLADLSDLDRVDLVVMLDERLQPRLTSQRLTKLQVIRANDDCRQIYSQLISECDAVWPIAPETGGILADYCSEVERAGKILLNSSADTVKVAGDKWLTYQHLCRHDIKTVETQKLGNFSYPGGEWIIKSIDGVGCEDSFVVNSGADFSAKVAVLHKDRFIVQPHVTGELTSLSCLFKDGKGCLLCANRQVFSMQNQRYRLRHIKVNNFDNKAKYQSLVDKIADALPGLWGYSGIDLIETEDEILVLEINPRLTTAFAGLRGALGVNGAALVLQLLADEPVIEPCQNRVVTIEVN